MPIKKLSPRVRAIAHGYRSGLEESNAAHLTSQGVSFDYEDYKLPWIEPEKNRKYTPDFILPNGIIIETKGRFLTEDRQKHLHIQAQHPDLDIRFVFSNPHTRISKQSPTTYAIWCQNKNFQYASKLIPTEWINEDLTKERLEANIQVLGWVPPTERIVP